MRVLLPLPVAPTNMIVLSFMYNLLQPVNKYSILFLLYQLICILPRILPKESFFDLIFSFLASGISFEGRWYIAGLPDFAKAEHCSIFKPGDSGVINASLSELNGYSSPFLEFIARILKQYDVLDFKPVTTALVESWGTTDSYIAHRPSGRSLYWIWYSKSEDKLLTFFHCNSIRSDFMETRNGVPGNLFSFSF